MLLLSGKLNWSFLCRNDVLVVLFPLCRERPKEWECSRELSGADVSSVKSKPVCLFVLSSSSFSSLSSSPSLKALSHCVLSSYLFLYVSASRKVIYSGNACFLLSSTKGTMHFIAVEFLPFLSAYHLLVRSKFTVRC